MQKNDPSLKDAEAILTLLHSNDMSVFNNYRHWTIYMCRHWVDYNQLNSQTKGRLIQIIDYCKETI